MNYEYEQVIENERVMRWLINAMVQTGTPAKEAIRLVVELGL